MHLGILHILFWIHKRCNCSQFLIIKSALSANMGTDDFTRHHLFLASTVCISNLDSFRLFVLERGALERGKLFYGNYVYWSRNAVTLQTFRIRFILNFNNNSFDLWLGVCVFSTIFSITRERTLTKKILISGSVLTITIVNLLL